VQVTHHLSLGQRSRAGAIDCANIDESVPAIERHGVLIALDDG
jgi:hypothetical protein